jgi:hypothetical protein
VTAFDVKRLGSGLRWVAAASIVLAVSGSAVAQSTGGTAAPPPPAPNPQLGFERRPQLSPADEVAQADAVIARMNGAATTVRRQLDTARQQHDVVKSLCLSDKLSQVDVATRSAKDRQTALQAAAQRNDAELANHEFTMLTVLSQRAQQLIAEANQCVGEDVSFEGQTQVSVDFPPFPPEDLTPLPEEVPPFTFQPPISVSPVK